MKVYGTQSGWYYFVNDHLGTPHKIVDASGKVVWAAAYLPFGGAQVITETVANNLRFPGQYFDAETGLHYNWNRYYDPKTGRYLTPDPIGLEGGENLYSYCFNNPPGLTDPEGLEFGDYWDIASTVDFYEQIAGDPSQSFAVSISAKAGIFLLQNSGNVARYCCCFSHRMCGAGYRFQAVERQFHVGTSAGLQEESVQGERLPV